jgi:hypothetical protein
MTGRTGWLTEELVDSIEQLKKKRKTIKSDSHAQRKLAELAEIGMSVEEEAIKSIFQKKDDKKKDNDRGVFTFT